ncbi:MAG: hypothetical protein ACR2QU_04995 [Gammaproteobacteria bacterium]
MKPATILLLAMLGLSAALQAAVEPPDSCSEIPAAHQLDFWLGEWDVVDVSGKALGINRIESLLGGCVVLEHWLGATGFEARSFFYFHSWLGQWRQVWVTAHPQRPHAVKEKKLVDTFSDGGVRLQGEIMISPENYLQDRTTLRPLPDGRVHQKIEWSNDDGKTWNTGFEGWYRRRSEP